MATNFVKLISNDLKTVEVDVAVAVAVAMESEMVKNMIEAQGIGLPIFFPRVSGNTLTKVLHYCKYHVESHTTAIPEDEIKAWDADFMNVDRRTFFALIVAANTLKINNLLDLACVTFATMTKHKTPEQIRKMFDIPNDFIPEEAEI